MQLLGLDESITGRNFPIGTSIIEFPLTLTQPFISRDDIPLYIIENPVRKDKVFGVPFTSAMGWKGNLRWAMMKVHIEPFTADPQAFAERRFQHTLLFGSEKGTELVPTGWAKYLNEFCPDGDNLYQDLIVRQFGKKKDQNWAGMLHFYPTFWDKIDLEVINPHERFTKTGTVPVYFEAVPKSSRGFFRVLFIPWFHLTREPEDLRDHLIQDLSATIEGLRAMMLVYGFSAKKSSGYGLIEPTWDTQASRFHVEGFEVNNRFGDFDFLSANVQSMTGGRDHA